MAEQTESVDDIERAFCEAVQRFALGEWSPAVPEQVTISMGVESYSIGAICRLVATDDSRLPDQALAQLLAGMHAQHEGLRKKLGRSPSYRIGAQCLIDLLGERVCAYQRQEVLRNR